MKFFNRVIQGLVGNIARRRARNMEKILKGYVKLPEIIPRFCVPSKDVSGSKIRLICLCRCCGICRGAAVYTGRELSPGVWSCSLATKSKMMNETIPRNELSAILLCAELEFKVKSALGSEVGEVIFATD